MKGDVKLNFIEKQYRKVNNNYRNIIALVAPFKDSSFVFKAYNTLDEAVTGEKTSVEGAVGYKYLQLLYKYFPQMDEIVLCNLTTNTGTEQSPVYNYDMTKTKLGAIFEELDEVGASFILIPDKMTVDEYQVYKAFYDEQRTKMNAFGLISPVDPEETTTIDMAGETITATNLCTLLDTYFKAGGYWEKVTTPLKLVGEVSEFSLAETTVYLAGLTASLNENISLTHYVLDEAEGPTTISEYDKATFDLINNSGGLAYNYRDKIHQILQIYNSGTSTLNLATNSTLDLKIERVHALIINEFRLALLNAMGKDNNQVTYDNFGSIARGIRDRYMNLGFITGLEWTVDKTGTAKINVPIQEKQNNIITHIDIMGVLIIE